MASFTELLKQLESRHEQELQSLRSENASLREQLLYRQPAVLKSEASSSSRAWLPRKSITASSTGTTSSMLRRRKRNQGLASLCTFRPSTAVEPKNIVFQELCDKKYPGKQWNALSSKQRVDLIRGALKPQRFLISPQSPSMKVWDGCVAVALVYTALVTPYEVVFLSSAEAGYKGLFDGLFGGHLGHWVLFVLDRLVDMVFIVDLMLQFFLKVEVQRPHKGGIFLLSDPWELRLRYLRSWFLIDLLGSFPYELVAVLFTTSFSTVMRAKLLKGIKLLRTAKLLRILRSSRIVQRWRSDVNLKFGEQRLLFFAVLLLMLSHWMACAWGLTGLSAGAELCDSSGNFIGDHVSVNDVSWVTALYGRDGKRSPDSACRHSDVYIASLHWAVMTITSTGYGDIVPVRFEEYVVGIGCMFLGCVLWAYVIGSICSIISNRSPVETAFETNCDLLNYTMQEAQVPQNDRHMYREFLREAKSYDRRVGFAKVAEKLSPGLRKRLLFHLTRDLLEQVDYFKGAPLEFMMCVASTLQPRFFSRGESLDCLAHCLCMMDRGTVLHNGVLLVPPSVFHEDFIITQHRLHKACSTVSLTFTQVLVLTKHSMEEFLERFPEVERTIRKKAIRLAFCRALHISARESQDYTRAKGERVSLSLAFKNTMSTGGFALQRPFSPKHQGLGQGPDEPLSDGVPQEPYATFQANALSAQACLS